MNINPYYGVMAGEGRGGVASHFAAAGFPFAQCADARFATSGEFYCKPAASASHYQHQNGAVHQLAKHVTVTNGNNNNNGGVDSNGSDGLYARECNGKLYGDPIHAMHVGSPVPGYPGYRGAGSADAYRSEPPLTPSPHRQGLPPLAPGQWSPPTSSYEPSKTAADPYKLSPETAATTPTHGSQPPASAAFEPGEPVARPLGSPPPPASCPSRAAQHQQQAPQPCSVNHHPPIPYYPWMGVVGAYIYSAQQ